MEILYFIDRTLTRFIQNLVRFIALKTGVDLETQLTITSLILGWVLFRLAPDNLPITVVKVILTFITLFIIHALYAVILKRLHGFFDPDQAQAPDKLYEDGYDCWGCLAAVFTGLGIAYFSILDSWTFHYFFSSVIAIVVTFDAFAKRKHGSGGKKKPNMATAALRALLERVKQLTYKPRRAYNPQ